ncbi:hypothetical protein PSHT_05708 [Puccinia striiformis]|uniref:HTH APSES-type domain-containing protein n=1 Tax=Puccinia striiformis TaxID=27350 RepID=A0A2S4W9U0_9BASI|nr:hypothetical protein PSHT_05708 [Puccinia striiformis]
MSLISPTRTLPSPRPIDTDPILNYRHIQPAAAAAADNHLNNTFTALNPTSITAHQLHQRQHQQHQYQHQHQHQHQQPFTTVSSHKQAPQQSSHLLSASAAHSPSSELSASPASTLSLPLSASAAAAAAAAASTGSPLLDLQPVHNIQPNSPSAIMLPQPSSDDDASTAEEEQPSGKPSNTSLATNNTNGASHPIDSHAASVSIYDLPTSSSAPTTSSSSSPFPSNNVPPQHHHQQPSYSSSSHPNQEHQHQHHQHSHPHHHSHHENQFYQASPPALHLPLQSTHQQSFDQRPHPHSSLFAAHQSYHSRPQSAPHSTTQFSLDPHVITAAAANVEVKKWDEENTYYYQVAHKGVTVGRLKGSGLVNGTKLLNLAGISRGKRDGILKNEKIRKVVKHGTMHLKGVWIAFDRAVFLAEQHEIADKIFPLLVVNLEHYVPIEPPIMGGGTKLGPSSLFHPRHPRLVPQPIKFPHPSLSLAPASANSFASTGPRSAATAETSPSVYEQAQFQYLSSAHANNPVRLLERRHTLPNNSFHGYNSGPSYGSSQAALPYPFPYDSAHLTGYPPRTSAPESATTSQFEYHQQSPPMNP